MEYTILERTDPSAANARVPIYIARDSAEVRAKISNMLTGNSRLHSTFPSLRRVKYEYVIAAVQACGGNVSKAAILLKTHRRSLQRVLDKSNV